MLVQAIATFSKKSSLRLERVIKPQYIIWYAASANLFIMVPLSGSGLEESMNIWCKESRDTNRVSKQIAKTLVSCESTSILDFPSGGIKIDDAIILLGSTENCILSILQTKYSAIESGHFAFV
eukprot:516794_1